MAVRKSERGVFGAAVLASILLHLSFIAVLPGWHDVRRPSDPMPITVRLGPQAQPDVRLADAPQIPREPAPVRTRGREPLVPRRSEAAREAPVSTFVPIESAHQGVAESSAPSPVTQLPGPDAREAGFRSRGDMIPATPSVPASAIGTLSQYRLAVMARARGFNRYPQLAIDNAWQGRSDLRLRIAAGGVVESVEIRQGSGYAVLDVEAAAMIGEAARRVPIPESLRGGEFEVEIPVIFSLQSASR